MNSDIKKSTTDTSVVGYYFYTYFEYEIYKLKIDVSLMENREKFVEFLKDYFEVRNRQLHDDSEYGLWWKDEKHKFKKSLYALHEDGKISEFSFYRKLESEPSITKSTEEIIDELCRDVITEFEKRKTSLKYRASRLAKFLNARLTIK